MKKFAGCCLCLIATALSAWAADAPQAKLVEPSQDLGTVFVGSTVKGKFYVENTGTVPFVIVDAKPTCHCTTAVISKDKVMPGARGEISYEITTAAVGKNVKNIRIVTDPPVPDQLMFTASVTFAPFIEADLKDLTVDVPQGQAVDLRIPLHVAKGAEDVKLLGATTRSRDVRVSLEGAANGPEHTLIVQSTNTLPPGKRPVVAELQLDKGGPTTQNVTVTLNIIPVIQISPAPIVVRFEPGKDEATVPLTLKNTKGNPFTITSIDVKACTLRDTQLPKEAAAEQTVSLTFVRPTDKQSMRGFLTFNFSDDLGNQTVYAVFQRELGAARVPPVSKAEQP